MLLCLCLVNQDYFRAVKVEAYLFSFSSLFSYHKLNFICVGENQFHSQLSDIFIISLACPNRNNAISFQNKMAAAAVDFYQNTSPDSLLDLSAIGRTSIDAFNRSIETPGINFALPNTNDVSIPITLHVFLQGYFYFGYFAFGLCLGFTRQD